MSGQKELLVVLLVDESGSLAKTDPDARRIDASKVAASGLASLADRSGGALHGEIQVARFGTDYFEASPWIALGSDTNASVHQAIESLRKMNSALDTDYVNALVGAQRRLKDRERALHSQDQSSDPCTAVLWFTDGTMDVEDRTSESRLRRGADASGESRFKEYAPDVDLTRAGGGAAARDRGLHELCRPGGIADQYRSSDTVLLAVALTTDLASEGLEQLRRIAAGAPGECGEMDGREHGALFPAADLSQLIAFFDLVVQTLSSPASRDDLQVGVCPPGAGACPEGTITFDTDAALQRFHLLAQLGAPEVTMRVTAPGAARVELPATGSGQLAAGDTTMNFAVPSEGIRTVDGESAEVPANWVGTWSVTFVDTTGANPQARNHLSVFLFGDVVPVLRDATFRVGETSPFTVALARQSGTSIPADGLSGSATVTAVVTDPSTGETHDVGVLQQDTDGLWFGEYEVPVDSQGGTLTLDLRAEVVTASGVALEPSASSVSVEVLPPAGFPTLLTRSLKVGPIFGPDDRDTARVAIAFEGSEVSDTCVWFDGIHVEQTPLAGLALTGTVHGSGTSESECVPIDSGGDGVIELTIVPTDEARGLAHGHVVLMTKSMNSGEVRATELQLDAELARPANKGLAAGLFAALMGLGVAIPLAVLYLANWWVAKFAPRSLMESCRVPVVVDPLSATRRGDDLGGAQLLEGSDFTPIGSGDEARSFTLPGMSDLSFESKVSLNPFTPPIGTVAVTGAGPAFGSDRPRRAGDRAAIGLPLAGQWVLVVDPVATAELDVDDTLPASERPIAADLVAFIPATERSPALSRLRDDLALCLPALVAPAHAELVRSPAKTASEKVEVRSTPDGTDTNTSPDWSGSTGSLPPGWTDPYDTPVSDPEDDPYR